MVPEPMAAWRILLLADDPKAVDQVTSALERINPECRLLRVDNRAEFATALQTFSPNVILSDPGIADFSAFEALHLAQSWIPECPFLIIGAAFEQADADCLKAGADDFIPKTNLSRLGSAIGAALGSRASLQSLSKRQRQVLGLIAKGSSTRAIAACLGVSAKTVETHRTQVMARLGIHGVAGLVRYAVGVGIVQAFRVAGNRAATTSRLKGHPDAGRRRHAGLSA